MDTEETKVTVVEADFSMRNLDEETIAILVEDKISTGG